MTIKKSINSIVVWLQNYDLLGFFWRWGEPDEPKLKLEMTQIFQPEYLTDINSRAYQSAGSLKLELVQTQSEAEAETEHLARTISS